MHRHQFYFNFSERKQINHDMIAKGQGLIVISESHVPEFKRLLMAYYEDREGFLGLMHLFLRQKITRFLLKAGD